MDRLVGRSGKMKEIFKLVDKISKSDATTILLQGESGTGKSLIARAIHFNSRRFDKPFMTITCTALPETLLESELMGHEKGSFTDAKVMKKGLFEMADGGTVFLDEIGDISLPFQAKLLTFLEEKTFKRVGGTTDIQVDVRIIAATNRDLETAVAEHRFRSDLYYRLKVVPIVIAPLRERREDIAPLVTSFMDAFSRDFRKKITAISDEAMAALEAYLWPGNIRELRNVIERAVLLAESDRLTLDDLPGEIRDNRASAPHASTMLAAAAVASAPAPAATPGMPIFLPAAGVDFEQVEKELVKQALARTGGNQTRAATLLGMNRDQIRYRIEKFGLRNQSDT
jgi:transcriptional regulator with GAF, ATPase, and Fis domain